jgi:hypothetical protein
MGSEPGAGRRLLERNGFWQLGWALGAMVLGLDGLVLHDFVLERGKPGIIEQSHGMPLL